MNVRRIVLYVVAVVSLCVGMDSLLLRLAHHERLISHRQQLQSQVDQVRSELDYKMNSSLLLVRAIGSYISVHPTLDEDEFRHICIEVMGHRNHLLNLVAAPDFIIRYVYPRVENEALLGTDYRTIAEQWDAAYAAYVQKNIIVDGPVALVQGGSGVIGRMPVFYGTGQERLFWGIVSTVIDIDSLLQQVDDLAAASGLKFALRKSSDADVFWGEAVLFSAPDAVHTLVSLPGENWEMAAQSLVTPSTSQRPLWFMHGGFVLLGGMLIWVGLLKFKNDFALKNNEKRLRDILMNSSGWIWETDARACYTMIAGRVEDILGFTPQELKREKLSARIDPEHVEEFNRRLKYARQQHQTLTDLEVWHVHKNGTSVCLLASVVPVFAGSGNFVGYRGVCKDITHRKKLQAEIEENQNLLDLFFAQSMNGFFFMMLDEPVAWAAADALGKEQLLDYAFTHQRMTRVNHALLEQYQVKEGELLGCTPTDMFQHDLREGRDMLRSLFESGSLHVETTAQRSEGSIFTVEGDYHCIYNRAGEITGHFGVQRDITAARHAEHELKRYIKIVDANVLTSQTDLEGIITYVSEAFCRISGYEVDELLGQDHNIVRHPDMPKEVFEQMWRTIRDGETWHGEVMNRTRSGGCYWVDTMVSPMRDSMGSIYGYMAVRHDITDKKRIEQISITDPLTGIYNRLKLDEELKHEHTRYKRYGQEFAVILCDIDHFKRINDTYGHLRGDAVLKAFSSLNKVHLRDSDVLGRWGGEEFLIIAPGTDLIGGVDLAEKLRHAIASYDFIEVGRVTASFGVAAMQQSEELDSLLKRMDDALYQAKEQGRNQVVGAGS